MIAVIADDLSGATELAGISSGFGLNTEIILNNVKPSNADVLVFCTDSRSLSREEALLVTQRVVADVLELNLTLVYKKIDSVLRGHVLPELRLQMELARMSRVLIVPANPSLGRIIKGKEYFVNGEMLSATSFANDPEFPVTESNIEKRFNGKVKVKHCTDSWKHEEVVVGETESIADVSCWANRIGNDMVLAGSGDFYKALLKLRYSETGETKMDIQMPHLYVSGTTFSKSRERVKNASKRNLVAWIPEEVACADYSNIIEWLQDAKTRFEKRQKLILAFDETSGAAKLNAALMRKCMAELVEQLVVSFGIRELFIEGGSTAGAIFEKLSIRKLDVVGEWERGVVRTTDGDLFITVKPGSYDLPAVIKELYGI